MNQLIYENKFDRFLFNTPVNISFPLHMHTGLETFYVEEGEIVVTVGNNTRILTAGDLAIAFPNQIHSYETNAQHPYSRSTLILCPIDISGDFMPILMKSHPLDPFLSKDCIHKDIPYALHSILKTLPDVNGNLSVIRAFIQLILARILPFIELKKNRDNQSLGLTSQLITYLSEHYTEPVTLSDLSSYLGVSKYSISRIFSEKMNTNFSSYINNLRINYAKLLLQNSTEDILSISMSCGYETPRTFNREFKAICGCQPREYRKKLL